MAITPLPSLDRTSATFKTECDDFFADQLPQFSVEVEAARLQVIAAESSAAGSASAAAGSQAAAASSAAAAQTFSNFKGAWSSLTGALNMPASVYHNGDYWGLLNNLANVTTSQPGVSADWVISNPIAPVLTTGDWNSLPARSGTYVGVSLSNAPTTGRVIVEQIVDSTGFIRQIAYPTGDAFGRIFYRQKQGGTWRAWRQYAMQSEAIIPLAGGAIDCLAGSRFSESFSSNRTLSVTNVPAAGIGYEFMLELTIAGGTLTWFSGILWPNNTAPTLTPNKRHLFCFTRSADGTDWLGAYQAAYDL